MVQGQPEEVVISTVMLRSMKQARYDADSLGHSVYQLSSTRILHHQFVVTQIQLFID